MNLTIKDLVFKTASALRFQLINSNCNTDNSTDKWEDIINYKKVISDRYAPNSTFTVNWNIKHENVDVTLNNLFEVFNSKIVMKIKKVYDQEDIDQTYFKLSLLELVMTYIYCLRQVQNDQYGSDTEDMMEGAKLILHFGNKLYDVTLFDAYLFEGLFKQKLQAAFRGWDDAKRWDNNHHQLLEYINDTNIYYRELSTHEDYDLRYDSGDTNKLIESLWKGFSEPAQINSNAIWDDSHLDKKDTEELLLL